MSMQICLSCNKYLAVFNQQYSITEVFHPSMYEDIFNTETEIIRNHKPKHLEKQAICQSYKQLCKQST